MAQDRGNRSCAVTIAAISGATLCASAQPIFEPAVFPAGERPIALATADLNADGYPGRLR